MTSTKTRKQGNSLVITIPATFPATLGIKEGEEFVILRKKKKWIHRFNSESRRFF